MGVSPRLVALVMFFAFLAMTAGCSGGGEGTPDAGQTIKVSGNAFSFELPGQPYGRISGASVSVLENPSYKTTTKTDGYFEFAALPAGMEATFVLKAKNFPEAQTKTFTLPKTDMPKLTFQIPSNDLFEMIAGMISVTVDPTKCQMVSTVTMVGKSIYDEGAHGLAGALVSTDRSVPAGNGPIYFNSDVMPDRKQLESSDDGGVLFVNMDPGDYVLTATKTGVSFEQVKMKCRANVFVNASPPYGLQALAN
ncbi:MAG: hypothetical protein WC889_11400 [Myxococcota bacterium]|jgi:hypothetical protein